MREAGKWFTITSLLLLTLTLLYFNRDILVKEAKELLNVEKKPVYSDTVEIIPNTKNIVNDPGKTIDLDELLSQVDQGLTVIDVRITQGNYKDATELIEKWRNFIKENTSSLETDNPEIKKRINELDHFSSIINTSDDELL